MTIGDWAKPESEEQSELERTVKLKIKVPANPFVDFARAKND